MSSKIGTVYTYYNEKDMLLVANEFEARGYTVKRERIDSRFIVTITGYK